MLNSPINKFKNIKKFNVLHIHTLPIVSGSGLNTFLTMKGLNKERYNVELACAPGGMLVNLVEQNGIKVRFIKHFIRPIKIFYDILALCELTFLLLKQKYEIVHTHNSKAGFIGRLAAKIARVGIVIHTIHGFSFHPYEGFWRRKVFIFLERLAANWCDRMIAISQYLIDWAIKEKIAPQEKLIKIYSGIEIEKFSLPTDIRAKRREFGIKDEDLVVVEVAKLWKGKGQDILLEAIPQVLKEIPQVKFLFVGEGDMEPRLRAQAKRLDIEDKVIFTGFRQDIPEITGLADVACLPSLWEGMGRSVLEAMACSKPVIATRVGGIVDLVEDGITGFLVPPQDPEGLARALIKLLKDENLRKKMGQVARKMIDERFSANKMVEDIEKVYRELLTKKGLQE